MGQTYRPNDFSCTWALMNPSQPLLLFNDGSVLHILNPITRNFVGSLAGHGGVSSSSHREVVRALTKCLAAHNIHRRPPEATASFLHDSKGFHDKNIRSDAAGETRPSQPHMATSEIWTKGRVSGTHARRWFGMSNAESFHEGRAAAGIHSSSPEGDGPGLCTIILAGGRSGGHQAAVMCAVGRFDDLWVVLWSLTRWCGRLFILPCL